MQMGKMFSVRNVGINPVGGTDKSYGKPFISTLKLLGTLKTMIVLLERNILLIEKLMNLLDRPIAEDYLLGL